MARLEIALLGGFQVHLDGRLLTSFESDKTRALLAFLAVEADRLHRRERLAELFWPDLPEGAARRNLRHTIFRLRQALSEPEDGPGLLVATHQHVQLNLAGGFWLDVAAFSALIEACRYHDHPEVACDQCLTRQRRAMELYRGDFLQGFSLPDNQEFTEWAVYKQEELHRQALDTLQALTAHYERAADYERVNHFAQRQIELEPWREEAHRQKMRALALLGQREAALRQFETCRRALAEEMGLDPSPATARLHADIRSGAIAPREAPPASLPPLETQWAAPVSDRRFVAREQELARLECELELALRGEGRVVFITGPAGSGASELVCEFARRAAQVHPNLLAAYGKCTALMGAGDPYEAFREALRVLTGDSDALLAGSCLPVEAGGRIMAALPDTVRAIVESGGGLLETMIPGAQLLARTRTALKERPPWQTHLEELVVTRTAHSEYWLRAGSGTGTEAVQADIFTQLTAVLRAISRVHPFMLVLDDLQWADKSSAGLLFYLARHLAGSRILVVGTYRTNANHRPLPTGHPETHPVESVMRELEMQFGDIRLDLTGADGRAFVNALIDAEPNRLAADFRESVYRHTGGHALFTVEMLRAMQTRGDLVRDAAGCWVVGADPDWYNLPPRVAAAIDERISVLSHEVQALLEAASIQGDVFTAEVLAAQSGVDPQVVIRRLDEVVNGQHGLIRPLACTRVRPGDRHLTQYSFTYGLYCKYLYSRIDPVNRARFHGDVAEALEHLYGEDAPEIAAQLAFHFEQATMPSRAAEYLLLAGNLARKASAWDQAAGFYARGLAQLNTMPAPMRREWEPVLRRALADTLLATAGWGSPEQRKGLQEEQADPSDEVSGAPEDVGRHGEERDPAQLALAHFRAGINKTALGEFAAARDHLDRVLSLHALTPRPPSELVEVMPVCNVLLAQLSWVLGYPERSVEYLRAAERLSEERGDPLSLGLITIAADYVSHLLRQDDLEATQRRAETLTRLVYDRGMEVWQPWSDVLRGRLLLERGEGQAGAERIGRGLVGWRDSGARVGTAVPLAMLAEAYLRLGDAAQGLAALDEAQVCVEETSHAYLEAELYRLRGELLLASSTDGGSNYDAQAEVCFQRAIEIAGRQGARAWELRAAVRLARLWSSQGKAHEATGLLAPIYREFTEGFGTSDLREAEQLLAALGEPAAKEPQGAAAGPAR